MSGGFSKTAGGTRARRRASASADPGSVVAAKQPGSGWSAQKRSRWLRVSIVVPDFDAARNSVRAERPLALEPGDGARDGSCRAPRGRGGRAASRRCGRAPRGTATTRPCRARRPARGRPRRRRRRTRAARARRRASCGGQSSQPSRSATSVGSSCQSVWSRSVQSLPTRLAAERGRRRAASTSSGEGAEATRSGARPGVYPRSADGCSDGGTTSSSTISAVWASPGNSTS